MTATPYLGLFGRVLISPVAALGELKAHPLRLRYAVVTLVLHCVIAIAKQLYFHFIGQPVAPPPFLALPERETWFWSAVFQFPTDFSQAILFAGTVTLLAPFAGGKGTVEGQFSLYAVAFIPPTIALMLGTLLLTWIVGTGAPLWTAYFIAVSLWILVMVCLAVRVEQQLSLRRAIPLALVALIPTLGLSLTYIR